MEMWYDKVETGYGGWKMYVQLTMAERLKDLRVIDKKLTLEQLAEQTGLSKSALGKYENEDCGDINHYAIQKLAKFYIHRLSPGLDRTKKSLRCGRGVPASE